MMKQTSPAAKIFSWIFALFWLVVCLLPFTQLISVTFSTADRGIVSTFYPNSLSSGIENIKQALLQTNMSPSTLQTLIYVSVTIVGMLIVSSLAAYELACFKFPGRDVIFMLILSSMMLPMITYIIPLYRFVYNLGWSDTLIGLAIPSIPSAFAVFIIRQFLESMPHELIEAGEIDGAGHLKIFLRVVLPLMATPLLTVTVGEFAALMAAILNEGKAVQDTGTTARGLGELADRLGCGRSKVSELRRLGVLDGAVVSNVGRKAIFDVETAMRLVSEYKMNK